MAKMEFSIPMPSEAILKIAQAVGLKVVYYIVPVGGADGESTPIYDELCYYAAIRNSSTQSQLLLDL
jgi:hypothetical protein